MKLCLKGWRAKLKEPRYTKTSLQEEAEGFFDQPEKIRENI